MNIRHENLRHATCLSGIYGIAKLVGKPAIYIGQAINFRKRWVIHLTQLKHGIHMTQHLQRAWNKYGPDAFAFTVIETIDLTAMPIEAKRATMYAREQAWLDAVAATGMALYNKAPAFFPNIGHRPSEATKAKISANHRAKGIRPSAEALRRSIARKTGSQDSAETRAKKAAAAKQRGFSAEHRENIRNAWLARAGVPPSPKRIEKFKATFARKRQDKLHKVQVETERRRQEMLARIERGAACHYGCGSQARHLIWRKPMAFRGSCSSAPQSCPAVFARLKAARGY